MFVCIPAMRPTHTYATTSKNHANYKLAHDVAPHPGEWGYPLGRNTL